MPGLKITKNFQSSYNFKWHNNATNSSYYLFSGLEGRRQPTVMTPVTDSKALNMLGRQ